MNGQGIDAYRVTPYDEMKAFVHRTLEEAGGRCPDEKVLRFWILKSGRSPMKLESRSVTRWLDYLFNIRQFTEVKIAQ